MDENPHHNGVLEKGDIEYVLRRFDEEHEASFLHNKMTIDTSSATVQDSLDEFVKKFKPLMTDAGGARMREHQRA